MKRCFSLCLLLLCVLLAPHRAEGQARRQGPRHDPRAALDRLQRDHGSAAVEFDPQTGGPAYLRGRLGDRGSDDAATAAAALFRRYPDIWGIDAPNQSLTLRTRIRDELGFETLRFEQRAAGLPVFGTDLRVEFDSDGVLRTVNGRLLPQVRPAATQPLLNRDAALRRALATESGSLERESRLGIARVNGTDRLAWELLLRDPLAPARVSLLIDARDGTILKRVDRLADVRNRETYDMRGDFCCLPGTLVRREHDSSAADPDVNAAHDNAGLVYDYFYAMHNRDSVDGAGLPLISTVHFGDRYNNAFWDGEQMVYGDGDGEIFGPLARGVDVVAHELTHGITEYTAGLEYMGQPGSLNEAFSDIFAVLIDDANWEIGETVFTPLVSDDALRTADDPTRYGDPSVWGEYLHLELSDDGDWGGIHSNSGIFNHIAYEIASTIGRDKTSHIFYRTLTQKLTAVDGFAAASQLTIDACHDLIGTRGIKTGDCAEVEMAFQRAGIGRSSALPDTSGLPHRALLPLLIEGPATQLQLPAPPSCSADLIRNGGFEGGQTGWPTDVSFGAVTTEQARPGGSHSAAITGSRLLLQWIRLPIAAREIDVRFWAYGKPATTSSRETLRVEAQNSDGELISTLAVLVGTDNTSSWQQYSATLDVQSLRDLRLVFYNVYGTHYIDDVSVRATCS